MAGSAERPRRSAKRRGISKATPGTLPVARTWSELLEQLYAETWRGGLGRYRSPFAYRGMQLLAHDLTTSLARLGPGADLAKVEVSLLRNFRKYAYGTTPAQVDWIWHWLAVGQHY